MSLDAASVEAADYLRARHRNVSSMIRDFLLAEAAKVKKHEGQT